MQLTIRLFHSCLESSSVYAYNYYYKILLAISLSKFQCHSCQQASILQCNMTALLTLLSLSSGTHHRVVVQKPLSTATKFQLLLDPYPILLSIPYHTLHLGMSPSISIWSIQQALLLLTVLEIVIRLHYMASNLVSQP